MELKHHPQSTTKNELETFINLGYTEMQCYLFTPVMLATSTKNLFRPYNLVESVSKIVEPEYWFIYHTAKDH